ncbi:UNVERIFIED_CONTAM: hypothetical protein FKN15_024401 [Acipenser sinensis]
MQQKYRTLWISCVVSVLLVQSSYARGRQGYLIAAPSVFRAGVEEAVSVTIFNPVKETTVQVQLAVKGESVAHSHGTVLVLINVFSVTPDLRPANEKIEAYIVDPRGSRMIQWSDLKPICCGIVNMSFPLSDQPVLGEWLVFVDMQGHTYNKSFEVQKYVLPKFELIIEPPRFIRDLASCEKGSVSVTWPRARRDLCTPGKQNLSPFTFRYTFGKPVTGKLTINMTVNGVGYYRHEVGQPVVKTMDIDGSATFNLCVKDMMPADVADHFRGAVNIWAAVSSVDGSRQVMFDDSTPIHKQLIDIKYSKDTRKQFKPGLPYRGKVEVTYPDGSPADGVTIRIKAELTPKDNVYTSELRSRGGLVEFEIPSIPTAAQYVWLETKVTAIDGRPAGDQYLPNYLSISSWYSPSKCHVQLQGPSAPLQVGVEAQVSLKSTCPCDFTLHYELASRGNIVQSGYQPSNVTLQRSKRATVTFDKNVRTSAPARPGAPKPPSPAETDVCMTILHFPVTYNMAPLSRLLVYYVRENGEGVTDSIQLPVQPAYENQVSISLSSNESMPGDVVNMRVRAERGSCVCVATVDKSLYLLKPGFQLTTDKIFQDLADFDVSDAFGIPKDDGHFWWPGLSSRRRRRSSVFPWHWDITKDARFAFTVHVKVSVPKGIKFVGHPGRHHLTRKKCVPPGEARPTSIVLSFSELGLANITARAFAYSEVGCCDEGVQSPLKNGKHLEDSELDRRTAVGMDSVRRSVLVQPEGLPREYTYSVFFCPNEKIHISTPNKYEYQYVKKPSRMTHFDVAVKAHNDAHLALSSGPHDTAGMVEIVIGGRQNSRTWVSASKMGEPLASAGTEGILSWDEFRNFWVSWRNGVVQVGHGVHPSNESVITEWAGLKLPQVKYVGFSTGWGSVGEFKIWRKEDSDENHNEAFTLGVPHNVVPGSERASASMIGDVMGPTLNNLDNLLRLPFGCGEQNMIHFAPNVFVLKYLQKTKQLNPEVEGEATDYLLQGYQRQLTYKRQDGSYSAFGERDSSGSMWMKQILTMLHLSLSHNAECMEEKTAVAKAKHFLETNVYSADDPYTTALTAYALTILRSTYAPVVLRKLNNMAITQDGFTHWSLTGTTVTDEDTFMGFNDGLSQSVVSAEVEMTAYALLTYTLLGDVATALPVVKWLSQKRNALGGFSSTQDTCVALQALSEYAILSFVGGVNLTISLASTNLDFQETFELNKANKKILQTALIPSIPTGLFVSAKGEGCCLMQIDVSYNVPDPVAKPAFQLTVTLKEPKPGRHHPQQQRPPAARPKSRADNRSELSRRRRAATDDEDPAADQDHQEYQVSLEACARWLHAGSSNMAVLEVPLLSGFRADLESLEKLLLDKKIGLKRYEVDGRKVLFYFDEIPSQCRTCVKFQAYREYIVGKTAPVPVKVYDYYEPAFEATRFYNVSEHSPLARELCDGTTCNEVESSANQWIGFAQSGQCNNVFGCLEEEHFEQCICYQDCGYDGEPVCASDAVVYQNQCQMEVAACRNSTRIKQVPMSQCPSLYFVDSSPGPRYYIDAKVTRFGRDGTPAYSMLGRIRDSSAFQTPGPGAYSPENAPHLNRQQRPPSYTMGSRTRYRTTDTVPAPNKYTLPVLLGSRVPTKPASASYTVSGRTKPGGYSEDLSRTPGPGRYNSTDPSTYLPRQPAFSMLGRYELPSDATKKPGPGTHSPEKVTVHRPRPPAYSLGVRHSEFVTPLVIGTSDLEMPI